MKRHAHFGPLRHAFSHGREVILNACRRGTNAFADGQHYPAKVCIRQAYGYCQVQSLTTLRVPITLRQLALL